MAAFLRMLAAALALATAAEARQSQAAATSANPIRKVVTMLQSMQKKVEAEGEKEAELYSKFMCYCKTSGGSLKEAIANAGTKSPAVEAEIKTAEAQKIQLEEDLKQHQTDRTSAKAAIKEATAIREKEAATYAAAKAEYDANLGAITKAVGALEKGMAGFLQTKSALTLKHVVLAKADMDEDDRQEVLAFLSDGAGSNYAYSPKSGEVTGILKELGDDMSKSLAELTADEEAAIKSHEDLKAAKTGQIGALTESIEAKTARVGETAVSIVQMKNDLSDTEAALLEDKAFLAELEKGCSTKTSEWEERSKTRADELVALTETIKILNDDDALDLFKKTLPSAAASLVQVDASEREARMRAWTLLSRARMTAASPRLDLIALALRGKKVGFEKVIKMVDEMVATLKQEQIDDDHKKEYCAVQLDEADDKHKALERTVEDEDVAAEEASGSIETKKNEIAALEESIKALDKTVAEQGEQRRAEHEEFVEAMSTNSAAKELLAFAKNRLNKFYNPAVYMPPPKRAPTTEAERIDVAFGGTLPPTPAPPAGIAGTGVTVLAQVATHARREAPAPPPETFGAYKTKGQETTGVIAMIDLLIKDLEKELIEADTSEKDAQEDYEALMADSAKQRAADVKSLTDKNAAKADVETHLQQHTEAKASATKELAAVGEYIASLHADCDWLVKFYDARKEARATEMGSLGEAKAVLSGAGFSLLQSARFLGARIKQVPA